MATQTLEFSAGTGLTLSCKLFALGSDTVVDTQTATEKTNDLNRYSVAFTDIPAGAYRLNAFVGAVGGFANEVYDLTLETATFNPRSESAGLDAEDIRLSVGLAAANLDTQLSTIDTVVDNIEADTQDIQSRLPAALVDGRIDASVGAMAANTLTASALASDATQEIGDAFLSHVITKGDPGSIERAFWQVTKAAASFDGVVQASGSNTASSFLTDIAIDDFAGQVIMLVDGALAGEARAITSVVSGVVTVHDAFTGIPADGVNFLVLPQQVYSISQIQNGLATSAGVTSAFTEIKGAGWSSDTDTLVEIAASGGGGGSGARAIVITTVDEADVPVRGARVKVLTDAGEPVGIEVTTSTLGVARVLLDDGSYKLRVIPPSLFASPADTSITVDADETPVSITLTALVVEANPAPGNCLVYTYVRDANGNVVENAIMRARLQAKDMTLDGTVLSTATISSLSDSNGYVGLELVRQDQFVSGTGTYVISVYDQFEELLFELTSVIPNTDSVNLQDM